jgi:hypothetical protein
MNSISVNFKLIFNFASVLVYVLGSFTFILTLLIDWLSPKRTLQTFKWYLQQYLYTTIAIILGMFICLAFNTSQAVIYVVGIIMGLIGSPIITELISRRNQIADKVVDQLESKVEDKLNQK